MIEDYYKKDGLGFYELKLQTLSSYSQDEIKNWAIKIGGPINDDIYKNIRHWVDSITLRGINYI